MPRLSILLVFFLSGSLLLACQGDSGVPSDPGRDLAAAGGNPQDGGPGRGGGGGECKDEAFKEAVKIYTSGSVRESKLKECGKILKAFKDNKIAEGEKGINDLLVAIYNDYHFGTATLAPVPPNTLEQSVANYIGASCGLAGTKLSASECLRVNDLDGDGIDADDLDGWGAWGPLTSSGMTLAKDVLQNGVFAFGVENATNAYVIIAERRPTGVLGPCPNSYPNDCQNDVFDVDVDGGYTSATVESCNVFGNFHIHCPEGEDCEAGETTTALGLVTDEACTEAGYALMGFWGKFAFQSTRSAHWLIGSTPAYAGVSTKFGAFSPTVLADDEPRTRGVDCNAVLSRYNRGSEGNTCRIFQGTTELDSCTTDADGLCSLVPQVPTEISVFVTIEKTGGGGAYNAKSKSFTLGPGDPPRDGDNKEVCFDMSPPRAKEIACS